MQYVLNKKLPPRIRLRSDAENAERLSGNRKRLSEPSDGNFVANAGSKGRARVECSKEDWRASCNANQVGGGCCERVLGSRNV